MDHNNLGLRLLPSADIIRSTRVGSTLATEIIKYGRTREIQFTLDRILKDEGSEMWIAVTYEHPQEFGETAKAYTLKVVFDRCGDIRRGEIIPALDTAGCTTS